MNWAIGIPGCDTIILTEAGHEASVFREEHEGAPIWRYVNEYDGNLTVCAFTYDTSTAKYYLLFMGTPKDMAEWFHKYYDSILPKYRSALEDTRHAAVNILLDMEMVVDIEEKEDKGKEMTKRAYDKLGVLYSAFCGRKDKGRAGIKVFESCRPKDGRYKLSYHMICKGFAVESMEIAGLLVQFAFGEDTDGLDMSIYTSGRLIRVPGMWKDYSTQACFKPTYANPSPCDGWVTAFDDKVYTMDEINAKEMPGWETFMKSREPPAPRISKSSARISAHGQLNEAATSVLNKYFQVQPSIKWDLKQKGSRITLNALDSTFCTLNPQHYHDIRQGGVLMNVESLRLVRHCFGCHDRNDQEILFKSPGDYIITRLGILQSCTEISVFGTLLDASDVLCQHIPHQSEWRIVRIFSAHEGHQVYLISSEVVIIVFRNNVAVYNRSTLEEMTVSDPIVVNVLVNRERLVNMLSGDMARLLTQEAANKMVSADKQNRISLHMFRYLVSLVATRGWRLDANNRIYEPDKIGVFHEVKLPETESGKSPIACYLKQTVWNHGSQPYRTIAEVWHSFSAFNDHVDSATPSQLPRIKHARAIGFKNGVFFIPDSMKHDNASGWFKKHEDLDDPVLCLSHLDVDYDPRWQDEVHYHAMHTALEYQGYSQEMEELFMAFVVGRPMCQKGMIENGEFDNYHMIPGVHGAAQTFKSHVARCFLRLYGKKYVEVGKPRGSSLGSLAIMRNCNAEIIVGGDLDINTHDLWKKEMTPNAMRKIVDHDPVQISLLGKESVMEPINSGLIMISNSYNDPVGFHSESIETKLAWYRRRLTFLFQKQVNTRNDKMEMSGLLPEQIGALMVNGIQRYLKVRQKGLSTDDIHKLTYDGDIKILRGYCPLANFLYTQFKGDEGDDVTDVDILKYLTVQPGVYSSCSSVVSAFHAWMAERSKGRSDYKMSVTPEDVIRVVTIVAPGVCVVKEDSMNFCKSCLRLEVPEYRSRSQCSHTAKNRVAGDNDHALVVRKGGFVNVARINM